MGSSPSKPKDVTLTYFNLHGRGEPIRMLLLYGDVKYKEHTVEVPFSPESTEWPQLKPSKTCNFNMKFNRFKHVIARDSVGNRKVLESDKSAHFSTVAAFNV